MSHMAPEPSHPDRTSLSGSTLPEWEDVRGKGGGILQTYHPPLDLPLAS